MLDDPETLYRAVSGRDRRFDGRFVVGVTSTGIYCRPSCPSRTPRPDRVRFFAVPAAAVAAGFRACRRCRPDALPGSRDWDHRGDLTARALRLIASGAVDDGGVSGLARRLAVSERHLNRSLVAEVGVGPLALARTRRAQTARMLVEQTALPLTQVAYASGFASLRQFNDVMRVEFGCSPRELRRSPVTADRPAAAPSLTLRLPYREPYAWRPTYGFLAARAIADVETFGDGAMSRALRTSAGPAVLRVEQGGGHVVARLRLPDLAALAGAVAAVRRWLDLDADPLAVDAALGADPRLAAGVRQTPGVRVPGSVDGLETAVRAVVGQQVTVAGARTLLGRIVARCAPRLADPVEGVSVAFPDAPTLAAADLSRLGLTTRRVATLRALATEVADGRLTLDPGADRDEVRARLGGIVGIGPWTVEYVAMRALGDPDAWPETDLALRRAVEAWGADPTRWRPWRAYAAMRLWTDEHEKESP